MQSQVRSDMILVGDLTDQIKALWRMCERFAKHLPDGEADIYLLGVIAGLMGIAEGHGLNVPDVREAEDAIGRRRRAPTKYDMKL